MIVYYLDASACVKRYYQELGTVWIQYLFAQNPTFAFATLGLVEVVATLARKRKAGQINPSQLQQKIRELEADWQNLIQVQLTVEGVNGAKSLAMSLAVRGADAVHLASASLLKNRLSQEDQLIFITSDHELGIAAQASGLVVLNPEEEAAKTP